MRWIKIFSAKVLRGKTKDFCQTGGLRLLLSKSSYFSKFECNALPLPGKKISCTPLPVKIFNPSEKVLTHFWSIQKAYHGRLLDHKYSRIFDLFILSINKLSRRVIWNYFELFRTCIVLQVYSPETNLIL